MNEIKERLSIEGPAGALEAVVEDPGTASPSYAIVCHPHPLMGGAMENKVVWTVARSLRETGIPTLRFNFRGVGASAGTFDEGVGETADADAVAVLGSTPLARPFIGDRADFPSAATWLCAWRRSARRVI